MKINWKIRLQNPKFWIQIGLSVILPILTYYGINSQDLSTWDSIISLGKQAIGNPHVLAIVLMSVMNTIQDPTAPGMGDSEQVLKAVYVRKKEVPKK